MVVQAIKDQADRFIHISSDYYHALWVDLCERLDEISPFQEPARTFLGNSGAEAIEAAIKLARHHTGRQQFIGFFGGFHGRTMGALSFTASKTIYRRGFQPDDAGRLPCPLPRSVSPGPHAQHEDYGEAVVRYIEEVVFPRRPAR